MRDVSFGVFDWIDRGAGSIDRQYEERLALVEAADAKGFFCYHLAEHHGTPLGLAPSPALFLSAAAQRTSRIRLGPLGYLLPLYEPLRLIEEVCMLDLLSAGRLELGLSRGVSPYELAFYGVDAADARDLFDEVLAVLLAGLTEERLTYTGRRFQYRDVPMELRPLQRPYPPLWYPTTEVASMPRVASHGYSFVTLGPAENARRQVEEYWKAWEAHREDPNRINGHVARPKAGILRQIVVADTDAEAVDAARSAHGDWFRAITKLWHEHGNHDFDALFSWETAMEAETIVCGSASTVRRQVTQLLAETGCNYVVGSFAWGTLPHELTARSLRLFADEVMPAFA